MSGLRAAERYVRAGFAVVPIPHRSKRPVLEGWEALRLTRDELPEHFNGRPQNVGLILGQPSGGLVDVDLDVPEATKIAGRFLPQELQRLGTELSEDHGKAVEEDDVEKAADLYSRRVLVGKQIEDLEPPLAKITLRRGRPVEVAFYREPSETELRELREKYPGYVVVASPVTVHDL